MVFGTRLKNAFAKGMCIAISVATVICGMPVQSFANEANVIEGFIPVGIQADDEYTVIEDGFSSDEADGEVLPGDGEQSSNTEEYSVQSNEIPSADEEDSIVSLEEGEQSSDSGESSGQTTETIEINQGLSRHTGLNDGNETLINDFVAKKQTVVMMKIPGSDNMNEDQAKSAVANFKLEAKAVTNGQEADNCELTASGDNFSVKEAFDADCDIVSGWYAVANFPTGPDKGTYNFHIKDGDKEIGVNNGVNFYETKALNILVVPVKGYWGGAYSGGAPQKGAYSCKEGKFYDAIGVENEWSSLIQNLKSYLLDVYPVAEINFEEGNEIDASDPSYDMVTSDGQKKLWEEACKLQTKNKEGNDRYDLILAFVQYRQDQGGGQGYTFGKPTNIITYSDKDMLPTVAHEIAHCYQVGDEYDGGSFNNAVNYPPNGYKGRNYVSGEDIASTSGAHEYWQTPAEYKASSATGSKKSKVGGNGAGTMVKLSQRPYSLSQQKFIRWAGVDEKGNAAGTVYPTISYMGSNYSGSDGYYWTSSVIWDHLFKQLVTKEKKDESASEQQSSSESSESSESGESPETTESGNAEVYINALMSGGGDDENSIFNEDDFYYDDDCRWGDSRMVEVNGWLVDSGNNRGKSGVTVEMNPMFSYNGDLEYITPLDDIYKDSSDIYTFVALDDKGMIITSPVDGEYAAAEFYGGFFNPRTKSKGDWQTEVNFRLEAEYPEGTADFAIIKGRLSENSVDKDGKYAGEFFWQASKDDGFVAEFEYNPEGYLGYADVNSEYATVEWDVYYPEGSQDVYANEDKILYTEVYYCPEGDDGQAYYVGCSEDDDWQEGYISFETDSQFETKWTRNAYVWIKVTNGVNAVDIYSDELEITLANSQISLSGSGIKKDKSGNYSVECTGSEIKPAVAVKAYDPSTGKYVSLKRDADYSVTYQDNIKVGYATVTVQGIGNYAGKSSQEFEIVKKKLVGTPGSIPDIKYGEDLDKIVLPYITIKDSSGRTLVRDTDFTVKYSVNGKENVKLSELITSAPSENVTVTAKYLGKGNYTGECKTTQSFKVLPADSEIIELNGTNTLVELKKSKLSYTGKAIQPGIKSVTVTGEDGTKIKLKSSNYKVAYSGNTDVGTARVTIIGQKGYTGSAYATFEIEPKNVKSLSVSGIKNQLYTGENVDVDTIPIVVKAGGIVLRKGLDYTVEAVDGCEYTGVTTSAVKKDGKDPKLTIKLVTAEEAQKAGRKSSDYPKVKWDDKVKAEKQVVTKKFAIVQTKLNSAAVSLLTRSNDETKNIVKSADGQQIGTIRNATRDELKAKNKFAFVITGNDDVLPNNAVISEGLALKVFGKDINAADVTVSVTKTKDKAIGTITYTAVKNGPYSGKKSVKFLYQKKQEDSQAESDDEQEQ